ncbi:lipopolysaccharide biosynthesis protein [Marinilactibacillus psychrotolerans]|uniref:Lipopolysaccharide biosynthesis protein n=1 Tax=Marinilactibacillus psychrotolerans TaxID=191770 RepID=A0A5R9C7G3_9LACT|nr:lipopolysaccharide biosynthesis protein [Marinilactibacillus psychrotolerans]TLQ09152.1 lipopolysaccharide biosynthesis protein [Marinilactibacillus psychrotolerans]
MFEQFKSGLLYTAIGKYSNVVVQLSVQVVLSNLLLPAEFGIVATVNVFLVFFQLLADIGIGPAIIQNKDLTRSEINSIFGFSMYIAIVLGIIFVFLGYPISWFYDNSVFISISRILGICVFFYGALVVPQSLLLRMKNFKLVNFTTVGSALISGIISISLAFAGFSYYSIIIGNTVRAMVMFIIFYNQTGTKFKFKIDFEPLKKIFAFSRNQFLFNFINYFSRNLDNLLIGGTISQAALGYYDKAYTVSLYPNQVLTGLITSVIHPIMSDYVDQKEKIKFVYLRLSSILAMIGMPLSVFLVFNARDIILVFGEQWLPSVPTLQILACTVWIQMILSSTGGIFQSGNRTDLLLLSGVLSSVFNISGILTGIFLGRIEYVALLLLCAFSLNFIQANYLLMVKLFESNLLEFFPVLFKPMLLAIMQAVVFLLLPEFEMHFLIALIIKGVIFAVVWLIGIVITGEFRRIKKEIMGNR